MNDKDFSVIMVTVCILGIILLGILTFINSLIGMIQDHKYYEKYVIESNK